MVAPADTADRLTPEQIAAHMERHEAMCWEIAHHYAKTNRTLDAEELAAAARLGFCLGAARFQPSRGHTFATYCRWWALNEVRNLVRRELGRGLKTRADGPVETPRVASLDAPYRMHTVGGHGRDFRPTIGGALAAPEPAAPRPTDAPDFWARVTAPLDPRSGRIVVMRFRDGLTFTEIGARLGVTRTRAQQLTANAVARLRRNPALRRLAEELA